MGDVATLAKARMELEELYLGVPDESVNLTFKDLADVTQNSKPISEKKTPTTMEAIPESKTPKKGRSATTPALSRTPSLDFNKGLQATPNHLQYPDHDLNHHVKIRNNTGNFHGSPRRDQDLHGHYRGEIGLHQGHATPGHRFHIASPLKLEKYSGSRHVAEGNGRSSFAYEQDVSSISMASVYQERVRLRRPDIPHSNICTVCSTYIYIFRHRCLVCGRAYCRQCVGIGMGEMTEGRKCLGCLGERFSQRAGNIRWCWGYPSTVKPAELKWAEKGPRRSDERACGTHGHEHSGRVTSRSPRSPITPRSHAGSNSPSFVVGSPYTAHTPTHHHLPF
ncbi:hypothetical protein I3843_13G054600 [Carya illinoinensis]|uniref:Uncharacterized protein n=1 Tax=Carya illinoinensis TaxID=32201 RepID=A0A8T1NGU3_CARIL|nr:hypothetical protein CIPAW_13G063700 [Carya illinoinensis]KAG6680854.1 hypothetical protein I3842_13G063000 [Carya illinoinensis]KAG7949300.1 hypothetical protein I3843_13G054600 [Carya illinoinensis]